MAMKKLHNLFDGSHNFLQNRLLPFLFLIKLPKKVHINFFWNQSRKIKLLNYSNLSIFFLHLNASTSIVINYLSLLLYIPHIFKATIVICVFLWIFFLLLNIFLLAMTICWIFVIWFRDVT